jgi:CheY-like chemotaxis protein
LARERQPAAIILDVNLPDTDGWQVMTALKADPETAHIPVHFVSGVDAADRGLAMGAVGYLTKPAAKQDLVQMINALASKAADGANRILVVEDDVVTGDSVARQLEAEALEVLRATSAAGALEALQRVRVACMVLDLGLPDMDGLELLETLRAQHGRAMPAVVIYTGRALSKSETKTLEAYTESVVLKDGASDQRLLDEVRIFVRRVKEGGSEASLVASRLDLGEGHLKGKTILVTDDDMRTVYAMSAMLRAKGAEVFVADTGQAALDVLDSHPDVDAALMDIMMPEMDGYEAMRRIRTDQRFGRLPIIALTARAMKGERERCIAAGATNYLAKPVDGDRLMKVLHAVMRRDDDGMPDVG